jgi:hypothetical protein
MEGRAIRAGRGGRRGAGGGGGGGALKKQGPKGRWVS